MRIILSLVLLVTYAASCGKEAPDVTPPTISDSGPTGTLPLGTTMTTLHVTTDEAATCKFSVEDLAYAAMPNTFTTTGGVAHGYVLTGLVKGKKYIYRVRCLDAAGNPSASSTSISFKVASDAESGEMSAAW